jgi:hypothetical protein
LENVEVKENKPGIPGADLLIFRDVEPKNFKNTYKLQLRKYFMRVDITSFQGLHRVHRN